MQESKTPGELGDDKEPSFYLVHNSTVHFVRRKPFPTQYSLTTRKPRDMHEIFQPETETKTFSTKKHD